jgi:NAD(P)H-hydrate repair Nnr-like enzyme with NAD(P)H-hydrate epimerase domain
VIDALFGFGFSGAPRPPYGALIASLAQLDLPVLSIDVPSGWGVDGASETECGASETECAAAPEVGFMFNTWWFADNISKIAREKKKKLIIHWS